MLLRPVFGWKTVPSFSAAEEERLRPVVAAETPRT
jgi:hypothetical protein